MSDLVTGNEDYYRGYKQGRIDAERDFQNSDYWNDYLAKVIADARADERVKVIDLIDRHMWNYSKEVWEDFQPILEQLKEQK